MERTDALLTSINDRLGALLAAIASHAPPAGADIAPLRAPELYADLFACAAHDAEVREQAARKHRQTTRQTR